MREEQQVAAFLRGGGAMGELIRAHDWSATPLGPTETWPSELKTAVALMLGAAQPVYVAFGPDLTSLYNDGYLPIVGDKHPGIGKPFADLWAEIWDEFRPIVEATMAGESQHFVNMPIALGGRPDIPVGYFTFSYTALRDDDGAVVGFYCAATETTDQVLAYRRRTAAAAQQRRILQQMPGFAAVLSGPEHRFEYVNDAYVELSGAREFLGRTVREVFPELEGQGFYELLDRVFATGEPFTAKAMPINLDRAEGERHVDFLYQPLRNDDGEVAGIFAGGYDVSDHVNAERALAASEARFRAFAQAVPDHVWTSPPDGQLDWFNERVYAYSGASPGALDGAGWAELLHPEDRSAAGERWAAALASGDTYETEFRLRRADGAYRWHLARALPTRGPDGEITRWIGTNTDIEDHKAASEALSRLNATLEQQVAERTGELMAVEEALRQSQKMEAVGQLTGGIAHDFNNMLAVVIGSLDLLDRRLPGDDPRLRRYMDAAADGARRAALLTQRLLAFSRQQPLRPETLDLNKLVAGMSDMLRHSIGADIRLETVLAGGLWRTHVDPNQLENVIVNLAVNARDAMPEGGGRITIETQNTHLDERYALANPGAATGQYVLVALTDTGAGMPPEVIARAFDPFFTTKEVGKGTGLGLSQVYGFVRQSGGHVKIYSEPGQGTTVKVYLPRLAGEIAAEVERASVETLMLGDRQEVILVVEDEPAVRQFSVDALNELGYRVLEADGAAAALRLLEAHPEIRLLFSDVVMPDVNGRRLADEAKARRPDLKVLFTTGYTRNAVVHNGVLDPGVDMIGKPFTIEALAAKVREVLDS